jgi:hypothetical protein
MAQSESRGIDRIEVPRGEVSPFELPPVSSFPLSPQETATIKNVVAGTSAAPRPADEQD